MQEETFHVVAIGEIDGKDRPMTKNAAGVWSVTIGPLAPDIYHYRFRVDGVVAMDPQNPQVKLGFGALPPASLVTVPGNGMAFDDAKPVPHGTVRLQSEVSPRRPDDFGRLPAKAVVARSWQRRHSGGVDGEGAGRHKWVVRRSALYEVAPQMFGYGEE